MPTYFTFNELTRSRIAEAKNIDNTPPPEAVKALTLLAEKLLDPVRELWGAPLAVNSAYRCPSANKAAGGSPVSQHLRGEAADITAGSPTDNRRLFDMIVASDLDFDQLIDERGYSWLHISYREAANRNKILHL